MIDTSLEKLIKLSKAADTMPGGSVHVSTIHRWRMKGCRGVKLETILRGGVRYTSAESLERFFAAVTAAANGEQAPSRTPRESQQQIDRAEQELRAAGI